MKPARVPRSDPRQVRLLVVADGTVTDSVVDRLPEELRRGDLVVVNDAATLPASLRGRLDGGASVEIRLVRQIQGRIWQAIAFGEGDWHAPTEERSAPQLRVDDVIWFGPDFNARVIEANRLSARLVLVEFNLEERLLWNRLYRTGKPIQYSYMNSALDLWSVQNSYSSRPWAVEMPSAGNALRWSVLLDLLKKGVQVVALTHGAGLSSTGDVRLDAELPLVERYDIPSATMEAVLDTKARGARVIAIGTSVVRALESSAGGLSGMTSLRIGSSHRLQVVDALLTGTHEVSESHYQLLSAFVQGQMLERMNAHLEASGYLTHEFGDLCLIEAVRTSSRDSVADRIS